LRIYYAVAGSVLQRLFSTFASGWPGVGLLLLRLLAGGAFIYFGISIALTEPPLEIMVPEVISIGAGLLILAGLWTPVAGALLAVVKIWIAGSRYFSHTSEPWFPIIHATLGAIVAMVGPGAWSIDARLFGRRRIDFPEA
jgi:uncharacterized membrane protein YphA (DoxX/SURF4 family)